MIPLEEVLRLLDQLRAEAIQMVETPNARDAFAFGEVTGSLRILGEFRARLEARISELNNNEDES